MNSPTLTDSRIESMRAGVMHGVDADIARRGRRARIGAGVAAVAVIAAGFGAVNVQGRDNDVVASEIAAGRSAGDSSAGGLADSAAPSQQDADASKDAAAEVAPDVAQREIVTTGSILVTVSKPRDAAQKLSTWVETIGGRIDSRSESGIGDDASAHLTVRVPSDKVTATVDRLNTYGTVDEVTLDHADVTAQGTDLDARIKALELSVDRLEAIMGEADSSAKLIEAETALTQRQAELDSLKAQRAGLSDQVSLSTLDIDLSEKSRPDTVSPGGFRGGLVDGWNGLVSTINHVVEGVGVILPWLVLAGLAFGAYRLVTRLRRSR